MPKSFYKDFTVFTKYQEPKINIMKNIFFLFLAIMTFNSYSQNTPIVRRVIYERIQNNKFDAYDTLWYSSQAKRSRFYYYDLSKMNRIKIFGTDTLVSKKEDIEKELKRNYEIIETKLSDEKIPDIIGFSLKKAVVSVKNLKTNITSVYIVYYAQGKVASNFYFEDFFRDVPGLVMYYATNDSCYTKAIEIKEVNTSEMNIPRFKR